MCYQELGLWIGIANKYDVCMHIAVEAHWCAWDETGKQSIVSIASTAIGTYSISKSFCEYMAIFGNFSTDVTLVNIFHDILV